MIRRTLLIIFCLLAHRVAAQQVWSDRSRLLPDQLRGIPTGIGLMHDPTPVYPEPDTDTLNYPGKFIWKHSTTVNTLVGRLTVVAAGSYIWGGDKGWIANIKLDGAGFAERFNCPQNILQPGKNYTFVKNWRYGDKVYAGDALWFILARDGKGRMYKGIAVVETEGTLKK